MFSKVADDRIQTRVLWCHKLPLCQPNGSIVAKSQLYQSLLKWPKANLHMDDVHFIFHDERLARTLTGHAQLKQRKFFTIPSLALFLSFSLSLCPSVSRSRRPPLLPLRSSLSPSRCPSVFLIFDFLHFGIVQMGKKMTSAVVKNRLILRRPGGPIL